MLAAMSASCVSWRPAMQDRKPQRWFGNVLKDTPLLAPACSVSCESLLARFTKGSDCSATIMVPSRLCLQWS